MQSSIVPEKLLLSARESAKTLSISERTLWSMTAPRGTIPCVRIGSRCLYSVDTLKKAIAQCETGGSNDAN